MYLISLYIAYIKLFFYFLNAMSSVNIRLKLCRQDQVQLFQPWTIKFNLSVSELILVALIFLALSDSFEYLCYGLLAISNVLPFQRGDHI